VPEIPLYEQQTRLGGSDLGPGPSDWNIRGPEGFAAGLSDLGGSLTRIQDEQAAVAANDELQQARKHWAEQFVAQRDAAQPGAPNFTPDLLKQFDEDTADRLKRAQTQKARNYLKSQLNEVRLGLYQDAVTFEGHAQVQDKNAKLSTGLDAARTAAEFRPGDFPTLYGEQHKAISESGLSSELKQAHEITAHATLADAAVRGMIRSDPTEALTELNNEKSTNPAVNALDFKDREALRNEAEAEIRRRETEARQGQAEAWGAMSSRIADTSAAYQRGLPVPNAPNYNEIAAVAPDRKDVDRIWLNLQRDQQMGSQIRQFNQMTPEQIAASRKGYAVTQGGFGAAEQLQRQDVMDQAARASIETRVKDPAGFAVENGLGWHPLNFQDQNAFTQEIRTRANTQGLVSQRVGIATPLLSKDETSMLVSGMEKMKPEEAMSLYTGLALAAGSDQAYSSMMQQINPDSPVRALVGLRALRSPAVALTMLMGEQILNETRAQKTQDGKPTTGLYLPETGTLKAAFNDAVGSAFADHPEVAMTAFQAVEAYYVGKAAKLGRLAADKSDIDTSIVKEAIKQALGTVVDYNGNGEVIAPWGMDASTFNDRVASAYQAEIKRLGMPAIASGQLSALGLRNAGDGTYNVMAGGLPLYDTKGNPVVLSVQAEHGVSGSFAPHGVTGRY